MHTIKDQGVLITGAGRGIGKRLALGFAAAGARVGLLARTQPELDLAKLEIEHAGGRVDKFMGDGVMALFGLAGDGPEACRQALQAARLMSQALVKLNGALAPDLDAPLAMVHFLPHPQPIAVNLLDAD